MRGTKLAVEADLIPYAAGFPPGDRWLVLAPHADDETLGIGATLALAVSRGVEVRVAIVTDGGGQGEPERREAEAVAATRELGLGPPEFWRFPDRTLAVSLPRLRDAIAAAVRQHLPDTLFVTSPVEIHPDHRAVALAALSAMRRRSLLGARDRQPRWIAAYEVATPLSPNLLVAADEGWERKRRAIAAYASQLDFNAYDAVAEALGVIRRLTLVGCAHAEGLHVQPVATVARLSATAWASAMGSPAGVRRRRPTG